VLIKEIAWREWEAACEQTPVCLGLMDLEKVRCVRKCISPSCYTEIYAFDEVNYALTFDKIFDKNNNIHDYIFDTA
jgi:hypothetical protein